MHPKKEHLKLLEAFNNICLRAYRSWHLSTNPALAKVGLAELFNSYMQGHIVPQFSGFQLLKKVITYYANAWLNFFVLLYCKAAHIISRQKTVVSTRPTIFIDCYFLIPNYLRDGDPLDHYFPGIRRAVEDAGWKFILIPRFYGTRKPSSYLKAFQKIRFSNTPVVTEFQLLTWTDYIYLIVHIFLYPLRVLHLLGYVPQTREGAYVRFALINGLGDNNVMGATRYLAARRLSKQLPERARCLQWFENQTFDKCFNRGLRSEGSAIPIFGAQLFLWPPEILNYHVSLTEEDTHKPDVILVNGPHYIQEQTDIPCKVGPAIRYTRLFDTFLTPDRNGRYLVLLPWFEDEARLTIELATQAFAHEKTDFKFHPAAPLEHLRSLIPPVSRQIGGDLYDVLKKTDLMIGTASGALAEAAAVGIPVIVIRQEGKLFHSYLPDIGRGLLWEIAANVSEIRTAESVLMEAVFQRSEERWATIETLRKTLFSPPSKDALIQALDLRECVKEKAQAHFC